MNNNDTDPLDILLLLIWVVPSTVLWGLFLMLGWNWWITDLGAPALTIGPASGIAFVFGTLIASAASRAEQSAVVAVVYDAFRLIMAFITLGILGLVVG